MSTEPASDFIRDMISADVASGKHGGRVRTRFPPEPNGHLHIGHAKSICLNFGVASEQGGVCHLRMDDTNPTTEDPAYVAAIQRDVRWLGFEWGDHMFYASDYYERLYAIAEELIVAGRAYVCDLTEADMAELRGTLSTAGTNSPFRDRSVSDNLALFRAMRAGDFKAGECTLRAKIDMSSPNMKLRDPPLYRIKHAHHYRTGNGWCLYPLYDYAHCLSDSFEGITHSLCTMEFESARELYDWVIAATGVAHVPRQTEFARLNLTYTVMSKRKLLQLVVGGHVNGWDDPRMPTIAGLRRRGVTPEAIRKFCGLIGVAKNLSTIDMALFEHTIREDLSPISPRVMAVLRPLKVTITNWPEGKVEWLDAPYWPHDIPKTGSRSIPFSGELYVDHDDYMEVPPKDFHRLAPGRKVRLRHGYVVTCTRAVNDAHGALSGLECTVDFATRGGAAPEGERIAGTIQWVSAAHALAVEARLYDRLCSVENPGADGADFLLDLNPKSLTVLRAQVEPSLASAVAGERFQFERVGFFYVDDDSGPDARVFNRTVALRDGWTKLAGQADAASATSATREKASPRAAKAAAAPKAQGDHAPLSAGAKALCDAHGISGDLARALSADHGLLALFESALVAGAPAKSAASLLANDVLGELRARKLDAAPFGGAEIAELLALSVDGTLSTKLAKDVLSAMFAGEGAPRTIVETRGFRQITDTGAVDAAVSEVLGANPDAVARYKAGNANVLGALVGLVMKASGGRANPGLVSSVLKARLA